ncbi:MAG: hypothetical protein Q9175_005806 [Cornicularia normoerica]
MNEMALHPPYAATTAALGGLPTIGLDVPICAVFLLLFVIGAACHMTIFQVNRARGHKFVISGMMFGFCMSRLLTMVLRMTWAVYPHNIRLAIAANIFVSAGVVLLFLINLFFAQRIFRASHPNSGWHPIFHNAFVAIYVIIVLSLGAIITSVIQSSYTLNLNTKRIDHDIQLYGGTYYAVITFLPILLVVGGLVIPRTTRVEKFGSGRFRHKIAILLVAATLLCSGASFRLGVNYAGGTRPRTDPAPYQSKACFYIFNFTVEIIVVYLYVLVRVDKRFHIPNNSHGPGDYSRKPEEMKSRIGQDSTDGVHIASEEEIFDDKSPEDLPRSDSEMGRVVDAEKAIPANVKTKKGQARAAAPSRPASGILLTPLVTPPPASHQPQEQVLQMSRD